MTPIDDRITDWLVQLERELANDDPALRHDAMSDAREHLVSARAELPADAPDGDVEQLLVDYGSPDEVADSYRAADRLLEDGPASTARTTPLPLVGDDRDAAPVEPAVAPATPSWFGVVRDPDAWAAIVYMLLALPLGIAWFTWTVTAGAVSGSLLVLIVGIPLVLAFLASIRGIALLDGRIVETLLGERMPRRSRTASDGEERGIVDRLKYWVTDRRTWSSIAYLLTMLPLGIAYFTVAVTLGAIGLSCIASPFVLLIAASVNDVSPEGWTWPFVIALVPVGAIALLALLHIARAIGGMHGAYAKAMLVGGDGASRRRRPVSIGGSAGRGLALLALAAVGFGIVAGIGTAVARSTSEVVTREASADGVERLELELSGADLEFVEDAALEDGEIRVEARVRTRDDDRPDEEELRIEQSGDSAKVFVQCDVSVWFLDGCESNVVVRVPQGGDIELFGDTGSGDITFAAAFAQVDLRAGSGDLDGRLDAREVTFDTGSGDIDVFLAGGVELLDLETGSGDVSVEAPGSWNVDVETGSGDEDVTVPRDGSSDRRMTIRTGSGDVEVEPGGGDAFDDDRDDDED